MRKKPYARKYRYILHSNKHHKKYQTWLKLFSCNYFSNNEYKGVTHKANCTQYKLCNDIEKNPGPGVHYVDPTKTIKAP